MEILIGPLATKLKALLFIVSADLFRTEIKMISKETIHRILKSIKVCHNVGFLPMDVDGNTGELKTVQKWKLTMAYHGLLFFNSVCYLTFMTIRLVQVLTTPELKEKSKFYLPLHAIYCMGGWSVVPWQIKLFFTSLDLNFKIYHDVLKSWPECKKLQKHVNM